MPLLYKESNFLDQEHWKEELIKEHELVVFRALLSERKTLIGWRALTPDKTRELGRYSLATRKGTILKFQ